jgi:hypothetical protein
MSNVLLAQCSAHLERIRRTVQELRTGIQKKKIQHLRARHYLITLVASARDWREDYVRNLIRALAKTAQDTWILQEFPNRFVRDHAYTMKDQSS